jgi:hypothetical protein
MSSASRPVVAAAAVLFALAAGADSLLDRTA